MTNEEYELISIIRNHENPTEALATAISVITEFLKEDAD